MATTLSSATRNFASMLRAPGFTFKQRRSTGLPVINKSGSSIAANQCVAVSGYDTTSKLVKVVLADADASNLATDVYVTQSAIANNARGVAYKGFMSTATLNTSGATTAGDPVYLSTTAGGFTSTAPTAGNARVQIVGYVQVKSASVGQIAWDVQPPSKLGSLDITGASADSGILTASGIISSANVLGTSAGQFSHASGVVMVPAGGVSVINQLVYCIIEADFLTAAYTGGGVTSVKVNGNGVVVSNSVTAAVFVQAAADISVQLGPEPSLTVASVYPLNNSLNLVCGAAVTQPGTAAGTIAWKLGYRAITSQLD